MGARRGLALTAAALAMTTGLWTAPEGLAAAPPDDSSVQGTAPAGNRNFTLYDGSQVTIGADGIGWRTDPQGHRHPFTVTVPSGRSTLGDTAGPSTADLTQQLSVPSRAATAGNDVVVAFTSATATGARAGSASPAVQQPQTSDPALTQALHRVGATSLRPFFTGVSPARVEALNQGARSRLGASTPDLTRTYVAHLAGATALSAAATLRNTPGIAYAEPDWTVSSFTSPNPRVLSAGAVPPAAAMQPATQAASPTTTGAALPSNYGLQSSLQSYLNASGTDVSGAFASLGQRFGQLPGTGEIITNVSLGDLTDQAMADAGDSYVRTFGPTTVVINGQRYLDYPSLPLIPTYTASQDASLNPLGTVEKVDPALGEVLLDFSVMAPLPHDAQRAGEVGSGVSDLLGIAPGARYRLVVPEQPTIANIEAAFVAAAEQPNHPQVISASLGFGEDTVGFPGRYLEDDPLMRSIIAGIVQADGISVTIAANDGTRMYTPAAVGPDGGSAPTNVPSAGQQPTTVSDDGHSTIPSVVPDSGAIAVGGTTLDDTVAVPPQNGGALAENGTFSETRLDGATSFASGFGTRIDVSAPSDNIPALNHRCLHFNACTPHDAVTVLSGGTSASAPMTAAAVADVLQAARLTGHPMTPDAVRALLQRTGRVVPTQPQIDGTFAVGPQIDVSAAVDAVLSLDGGDYPRTPAIVRLSVAHRQTLGNAGAQFVEATDPTAIDLQGPKDISGNNTGENLVGPVTIAADVTGLPLAGPVTYALLVGGAVARQSSTPVFRLTPTQLLTLSGQPVVSTTPRSVPITLEVLRGPDHVIASASEPLTFSPSDGTHVMAPAPVVAPTVAAGSSVNVAYDLTGVSKVRQPLLIVSSIDHWSPFAAPLFRVAWSAPVPATSGVVTVPASVFAAGGGVYGVGVEQDSLARFAGAFASFRVVGATAGRPAAPTLASPGGAPTHLLTVSRGHSAVTVRWDARTVPGAAGANLEISAPGPTIYSLLNTFTNQNGSQRDDNGVDSASTLDLPLPGVSGSATLDPVALGVPTSLLYTARITATDSGGHPLGEASPVSTLEIDDGVAPGGGSVGDFSVSSGSEASVSVTSFDSSGNPTDSSVYAYSPATTTYGTRLADDPSGASVYTVFGTDSSLHRTVAAQESWTGTAQSIQTYDDSSGQQLATVPVDAATQGQLIAGRVDETRHRAAILGWRTTDGGDVLTAFDVTAGTAGGTVPLDTASTPRHRLFDMMDINRSTGVVDLVGAYSGDLCILRNTSFATANLDTQTVSPTTALNRCGTGVASDQAGTAHVTVGPLYSYPMLPSARILPVDEATGQGGALSTLPGRSPIWPVVDSAHQVLVVGFLGGSDYLVNNDGMSAVGVFDLKTGALISMAEHYNFVFTALGSGSILPEAERGIQLDPSTGTAWTYAPLDNQLQQFSYLGG
ncbi:MAG TPA: peptidase S8 [Candidatus Dormibacteraeota bacterium]|nr:peptidase S8 [Candidatus Dormibacteraeota bacterium]